MSMRDTAKGFAVGIGLTFITAAMSFVPENEQQDQEGKNERYKQMLLKTDPNCVPGKRMDDPLDCTPKEPQ